MACIYMVLLLCVLLYIIIVPFLVAFVMRITHVDSCTVGVRVCACFTHAIRCFIIICLLIIRVVIVDIARTCCYMILLPLC